MQTMSPFLLLPLQLFFVLLCSGFFKYTHSTQSCPYYGSNSQVLYYVCSTYCCSMSVMPNTYYSSSMLCCNYPSYGTSGGSSGTYNSGTYNSSRRGNWWWYENWMWFVIAFSIAAFIIAVVTLCIIVCCVIMRRRRAAAAAANRYRSSGDGGRPYVVQKYSQPSKDSKLYKGDVVYHVDTMATHPGGPYRGVGGVHNPDYSFTYESNVQSSA